MALLRAFPPAKDKLGHPIFLVQPGRNSRGMAHRKTGPRSGEGTGKILRLQRQFQVSPRANARSSPDEQTEDGSR